MAKAFIVCGAPGSGKTTHARELAETGAATLLDIDTVSERLVKIGLVESGRSPDDRDSDYFKRTYRAPIYQALFDIARENLHFHDVIIVGPFTREIQDPHWPVELSSRLNSPVVVHYVQCPAKIRRQRLAGRGDARDQAKLADWDNYIRYYQDEHPPACEHVLVDGMRALVSKIQAVPDREE